jgi:L-aspartate oxidase
MTDYLETEVLIIGCGIAGGTAALQLADAGVPVTVVTRTQKPLETNTYYAQGGIIYRGADDSPELLMEDLNRAGADHCNPKAIAILAEEGPELVKKILIERVGVPFDRTPDGKLGLIREGSHSSARILHATDATGRAIEIELVKILTKHPNVTFLTGYTAVDLLTPAHHSRNRLAIYEPHSCVGAYALNRAEERIIRCLAKKTILATGGLGQIFLRTTNPAGARGDGLAMAYRAGASLSNFTRPPFTARQPPTSLSPKRCAGPGRGWWMPTASRLCKNMTLNGKTWLPATWFPAACTRRCWTRMSAICIWTCAPTFPRIRSARNFPIFTKVAWNMG